MIADSVTCGTVVMVNYGHKCIKFENYKRPPAIIWAVTMLKYNLDVIVLVKRIFIQKITLI